MGGSHKARHLFGVALHLAVTEDTKETQPLAIASCGNAAIAAAIVAKAINRPILEVFVPTWAEISACDTSRHGSSNIQVCESNPSTLGDHCYAHFIAPGRGVHSLLACRELTLRQLLTGGALGWELRDQVDNLERVFVQVGGGALGTATGRALPNVALYPVQVAGALRSKRLGFAGTRI